MSRTAAAVLGVFVLLVCLGVALPWIAPSTTAWIVLPAAAILVALMTPPVVKVVRWFKSW